MVAKFSIKSEQHWLSISCSAWNYLVPDEIIGILFEVFELALLVLGALL